MQGCSVAGRAEDRDCSAERLDPVFEADDARAAAGVGAAYSRSVRPGRSSRSSATMPRSEKNAPILNHKISSADFRMRNWT